MNSSPKPMTWPHAYSQNQPSPLLLPISTWPFHEAQVYKQICIGRLTLLQYPCALQSVGKPRFQFRVEKGRPQGLRFDEEEEQSDAGRHTRRVINPIVFFYHVEQILIGGNGN
ncbi:Uncharacterized protein Adt_18037 [Abeliophyllum distichum]|uniref:Uncharacterized protein n=1 Tax=Abeliophyllum distichum TaxID=126358 RepID=A0ABD1TI82_9LAMI